MAEPPDDSKPKVLDLRPRCCKCGGRWIQPEGVDAQVVPCPACRRRADMKIVGPIKLPSGGTVIHLGPGSVEDAQKVMDRRHQIVVAYCEKMGWPTEPKELSIDQILEIRLLPEWQNAGKESN